MLRHLVLKEVTDQFLSLRFLILSGVSCVFTWFGLLNGALQYQEALGEYRLAETVTRERINQLVEPGEGLALDRAYWGEFFQVGVPFHRPPTAE